MLRLEHVTLTYRDGLRALDAVCLDVGPGLFGLLGPNGAGKSSLMRVLATLQVPDSGAVSFGGRDVLAEPRAHRRRLGYLPQEFGAYPGVSALELLRYLAVLKEIHPGSRRRHEVNDLLQRVNLWEHRHRAVHSFSGGMRQRFGIAQALLGKPELVIVDEPTAGLDPEERARCLDLLSEVSTSMTVILSTHLVDDVRQLCGSMAVMGRGRVLRFGAPGALVEALEDRIWVRSLDVGSSLPLPEGCLPLGTQLIGGRRLLRVLAPARPSASYERAEAGLEDVYFASLAEASA